MINSFSDKQLEIFRAAYDDSYHDIIAHGAVRTGKTLCLSVALVMWAMDNFDGANFAICGKTVSSAIKNIILPFLALRDIRTVYEVNFKRSLNCMEVRFGKKVNYFYVYGGQDERSQDLIQGITLSGLLLDEVALMPQSFVNQAIARTISVKNAKRFYNCNPESPNHYFYKDFILRAEERHFKVIHFLLTDNPALDEEQIQQAYSMYTGVFYNRFILGQWVRAEGIIYGKFVDDTQSFLLEDNFDFSKIIQINIGVDFGGSGSATTFVCTGFTRFYKEVIVLEAERHPEELSPEMLDKLYHDFVKLCTDKYRKFATTYADSAEQILIRGLRNTVERNGLHTNVHNARKMEILERIRLVCKLMGQGRFKVAKHCKSVITALQDAVWDEKKENERLDDGTTDIDTLDAMEYSIEPNFRDIMDFTELRR